ncbi:MAG: hypothetical protein QUU85_09800, partial [Candidatus Eisenbacteria bacterium]|nr:hypothetical protein [Candidatus Eisenbacteria bacterium]
MSRLLSRGIRVLLPLAVLASSGCYGAKLLRQPIAVDETNETVKALSERQELLEQRLAALEQSLARQEEMVRALRADTQTTLTEITQSVETVGSRLDDALTRPSAPPVRSWVPPSPAGASGDSARGAVNPAEAKMIYDNAYLDMTRG